MDEIDESRENSQDQFCTAKEQQLSCIAQPISQCLANEQSGENLHYLLDMTLNLAVDQSTRNVNNNENDCYTSGLNSQSQSFPVQCESQSQTVQRPLAPCACEDDIVLTQNNVTLPEPLPQAHLQSSTMIIVNTSLGDEKPKDSSVDPDNMIQVGADLKHANESATQICDGHMPETPSVCTTTHVQEVIEYKSSTPTALDHDCNNTVAISDEPLKLIKLEKKKKESDNTSCSQAESENFDVHMSSSENYRLETDATNVDVVAVSVVSEYDESCGDSDLISVSVSDPVFTLLQQELIQSQSPHDAPTEKCRKTFHIKCPLPEKSVKPHICGYKGGTLISSDGGIKIMVPEGAIHDRDQVIICIGTDSYAPFVLPSQRQTDLVSPYYWIGIVSSYYFRQSIQVEFEYYGACDTSHYQLLSCEIDDESYTMRPVDYDLSFKVQDNVSLCSFQTYHFCSHCLLHGCTDPVIKKIGTYRSLGIIRRERIFV